MTVINNATLILKDKQGNEGVVKSFTDNDINKIANAITDIGQVVDPATHTPIEATKTSAGVVQLATAQDITNGTAGKVVDAKELINFAQTLPAANGITDVSSGDTSNQIVVSKFGGSKTLIIDNVEHASNADEATHAAQADTATSANSVAWNNVSGKPSTFAPATHNHDSAYLGITAKAESAKSADSVAWANVSGKPSTFTPSSHTHDDRYYTESEIDTKLSGKSNTNHTHSNYLTGITKAMVTAALGYTPPTSDTNTWNALKGSTTSAAGTAGYAPAPAAGAANRYLRCDGTWQVPPDTNTTYSKLSQFTNDSGYITSSGSCTYATSAGNGVDSYGGNWIRYKCGLQMCWNLGAVGGSTWTFPKTFTSGKDTCVYATVLTSEGRPSLVVHTGLTASSVRLLIWDTAYNQWRTDQVCNVLAIGQWK